MGMRILSGMGMRILSDMGMRICVTLFSARLQSAIQ